MPPRRNSRSRNPIEPIGALDAEMRALVESVHEPVLILDSALHVVAGNQGFFRAFGAAPEQIAGRLVYEIENCRWNVPELKRLLEEVLPGSGYAEGIEVPVPLPGGGSRDMKLNARRIEAPGREPLILLAIEDLTERKRMDEAIRRSNAEISSFAYAAAHDLQAPIRTIKSYAGLLVRKYGAQLEAPAAGYIGFIQEGASNMEELIRSLLHYATATEPDPGAKMSVPLKNTFARVLADLDPLIKKEAAEVSAGPLPTVSGHPSQIRQLLENLISNAIKYHKPGVAPRVEVAAKEAPEEWIFSVRDNGTGIDPQYQDQIFEPLKRLHGREIPGAGLGLASCRKVVERHGGRIWVESQSGEGSTFYFTLPK